MVIFNFFIYNDLLIPLQNSVTILKFVFPSQVAEILAGKVNRIRVLKSGPGTQVLLARLILARGGTPVLLLPDAQVLAEAQALIELFDQQGQLGPLEGHWVVLPPYPADTVTIRESIVWAKRMASLYGLVRGSGPRGVLTTIDNLLPKWPPRDFFEVNHLKLRKGEELSSDLLLEQAAAWGYNYSPLVSWPGELTRRGDILDIFSPGYNAALRVEFLGDVIEDMRLFDPSTQRSKRSLDEAVLLPVAPVVDSSERLAVSREWWRQCVVTGDLKIKLAQELERRIEAGEDRLVPPGLYYPRASFLEAWLPRDAVFLVAEADQLLNRLEKITREWEIVAEDQGGIRSLFARGANGACQAIERFRRLDFEKLILEGEQSGLELPECRIESFEELLALMGEGRWDGRQGRDRPWHVLVELLKDMVRTRPQTILSFGSERARRKFLWLAENEGLQLRTTFSTSERGLYVLVSQFQKGLELNWARLCILAENVLQPGGVAKPPPDISFIGLSRFDDLVPGDLLVHRDYGLSRFGGLYRLELDGAANDFLLLHYSGEDRLYLPVDRMSLAQRYKGPEETAPPLDRLGGVGWLRTRERTRKAIEKIAYDLVEMYAWRHVAKGFTYGPVGEMYREFEASFGFEETIDQARAIQDVLRDMERSEPMDRLVCGDVGFGKTEVALRAAFRAALEGRQAVMLCPTTVLAEQHYQTFRHRLQGFPVNVAVLSRFVPRERQRAVVEAVAKGQIDVLIGTHRLLSKDIQLPNLGLLILDEEQRFGVKHKERLKRLRKNIDVLTLTATPIPRTLQLSLSGIRQLSVIETPPLERKAVLGVLVEQNEALLRTVLERELARDGQIFWVHNRVEGLIQMAAYVQRLAPQARVGIAHGQMAERDLEAAMHRFWCRDLDILVCTAIVESGLDFPRANTLIVNQAQLFGLGQLYQLRGRVGRSDRQAYAYFVVKDLKMLSETAQKRLKTILDLEYLGAGFQLAMEDLRLRGAGNILGESQSGHIAKVGLDLFLEMLKEEIQRLKGVPMREETEPELGIAFPAHIPEAYIIDPRERLHYYKSLSSATREDQLQDLVTEMRDRFGSLPDELVVFLAILSLKRCLSGLQVLRADIHPDKLKLVWGESTCAIAPERLISWVLKRKTWAKLIPPASLELRLDERLSIPDRLRQVSQQLEMLLSRSVAGGIIGV
ncbi:Transcription-repair-coupling factor [Desulfovibrionales bacterium]